MLKPEVTADMPKPEVAADMPKPEVAADMPKPEVAADMPKPEVAADMPKPEVAYRAGKAWDQHRCLARCAHFEAAMWAPSVGTPSRRCHWSQTAFSASHDTKSSSASCSSTPRLRWQQTLRQHRQQSYPPTPDACVLCSVCSVPLVCLVCLVCSVPLVCLVCLVCSVPGMGCSRLRKRYSTSSNNMRRPSSRCDQPRIYQRQPLRSSHCLYSGLGLDNSIRSMQCARLHLDSCLGSIRLAHARQR